VVEKIIDGRIGKFYEDLVLLEQPFIKDDSLTMGDLVTRAIAELGETSRSAGLPGLPSAKRPGKTRNNTLMDRTGD